MGGPKCNKFRVRVFTPLEARGDAGYRRMVMSLIGYDRHGWM